MFFARFVKGVIIYGVHKGGGLGEGKSRQFWTILQMIAVYNGDAKGMVVFGKSRRG